MNLRTIHRRVPLVLAALLSVPVAAQTVTVTTAADDVDIDWTSATIADLPGPDGKVSLSEAIIATNHTPGHQTIAFAVPQSDWTLQFLLPGRAVFTSLTGFFWNVTDTVTIDGTTQTAFTGDTNPDGHEVALYGDELRLNADDCTLIGFDSSSISLSGVNGLIEGNTGGMNIDLFMGGGSVVKDNEGGTIKIDRSSDNVVVGNRVSRVRIQGFAPLLAANNRIGGPTPEDRNIIRGFGSYNSEGLPSGQAVQLFQTEGTLIENNWIGTEDGLTIGNLACTIGISIETLNHDVTIRDNLISGIYGLGIGPHHAGQLFGRGVLAWGDGAGLTLVGNTIGPDITGAPTLGAVWGLDLGDPVTNKLFVTDITIEENEIAGHILNGVTVGRYTSAVRLARNSIHDNGWLGIDLRGTSDVGYGVNANDPLDADTGGSGVQNFPVIDAALVGLGDVALRGTLHSTPDDDFVIEFFASPECDDDGHGEGQTFLGAIAVTTDVQGDATFDVVLDAEVPAGWVIATTATLEPAGATSEFSACVTTNWRDEGNALAGAAGEPRAFGGGTLSAGMPGVLSLVDAAPTATAVLFVATSGAAVPFKGGTLMPVPWIGAPVVFATDGVGEVDVSFVMPAGLSSGTELWFQWAVQDAGGPVGVALSNAIVGTTP